LVFANPGKPGSAKKVKKEGGSPILTAWNPVKGLWSSQAFDGIASPEAFERLNGMISSGPESDSQAIGPKRQLRRIRMT
jgi:hypothetical protein